MSASPEVERAEFYAAVGRELVGRKEIDRSGLAYRRGWDDRKVGEALTFLGWKVKRRTGDVWGAPK